MSVCVFVVGCLCVSENGYKQSHAICCTKPKAPKALACQRQWRKGQHLLRTSPQFRLCGRYLGFSTKCEKTKARPLRHETAGDKALAYRRQWSKRQQFLRTARHFVEPAGIGLASLTFPVPEYGLDCGLDCGKMFQQTTATFRDRSRRITMYHRYSIW